MSRQRIFLGTVSLQSDPSILLYAEVSTRGSRASAMTLKQTLAGLLDTRFKTCDSEEQKDPPGALITIDEVLELWALPSHYHTAIDETRLTSSPNLRGRVGLTERT